MKSPKNGAKTQIWACISPKLATVSGLYFADCSRKTPSAAARNPEYAKRLWDLSIDAVAEKHTSTAAGEPIKGDTNDEIHLE
jgi:hypothetical protein